MQLNSFKTSALKKITYDLLYYKKIANSVLTKSYFINYVYLHTHILTSIHYFQNVSILHMQ